ncbi:MAG: butyrate kinase [Bacteroidales bacterium]|nr:butyrate kinase [Bacteroidales bacterium]
MDRIHILVINPGSTSTKIAVYENTKSIFLKTLRHSSEKINQFKKITDQFQFRKDIILKELEDAKININNIKIIVGRGGLVRPIESGIYYVNKKLKEDLILSKLGEHASNLGGLIADDIASEIPGAKAYIVDPVVVDEMQDVARITGHPKFERVSIFHALNQKAIARTYAKSIDKNYEDLNLIVAHLGGGTSVGAHKKGRVIDINNALDGDGPFSPERTGTLPIGQVVKLCFSGEYSLAEVKKMIKGEGGLVAYLGTNDAYEVELKAKAGDKKAQLIQDAMAYQVGKEIGALSAVLKGDVDAILITGGVANNPFLVNYVKEMVSFIAPVIVYPGEDEMKALAMNGYLVATGELKSKEY